MEEHFCNCVDDFPTNRFFQLGEGKGSRLLIVGESPAENGWRKSGRAFYTPEGKLLATGKRLNELLERFDLDVKKCGFTELSKCFVGKNRKILGECCRKCWPIFIRQLSLGDYELIITMGVVTADIFGEMIDRELKMGEMEEVEISGKRRKVMPIFHPSPANPWGREKNKKIFNKYYKGIKDITLV